MIAKSGLWCTSTIKMFSIMSPPMIMFNASLHVGISADASAKKDGTCTRLTERQMTWHQLGWKRIALAPWWQKNDRCDLHQVDRKPQLAVTPGWWINSWHLQHVDRGTPDGMAPGWLQKSDGIHTWSIEENRWNLHEIDRNNQYAFTSGWQKNS
jgi:hypothetical protein